MYGLIGYKTYKKKNHVRKNAVLQLLQYLIDINLEIKFT